MPLGQLLAIQIITFLGLIAALRLLFHRQLNAALQRLQALQQEAMVKEAQLKEELERARRERAAAVDQGKQEARALIDAAKQESESLRRHAEEQARQASQTFLERGRGEAEKLRANLTAQIETEARQLAMAMIRCTFTQDGTEVFQRHALDGLISDIGRLDPSRFVASTETARVTSSCSLSDQERHRLRKILSEKLQTPVSLDEQVDPELIAGLVVQVGDLVIDGSLQNKLRKARALLRAKAGEGAR
ncbi:MAG: F0F1 ATP synthase subunit delta [Candidatus Omnitrophica bacterium]|nr:F0F1 ATP synthase subunit delta [Candidatus Omnitrophota bacterium]